MGPRRRRPILPPHEETEEERLARLGRVDQMMEGLRASADVTEELAGPSQTSCCLVNIAIALLGIVAVVLLCVLIPSVRAVGEMILYTLIRIVEELSKILSFT